MGSQDGIAIAIAIAMALAMIGALCVGGLVSQLLITRKRPPAEVHLPLANRRFGPNAGLAGWWP